MYSASQRRKIAEEDYYDDELGGKIDYSGLFSSQNFDPDLMRSLYGRNANPRALDGPYNNLMRQQQLQNGIQPGTTQGYNPAQMQQSQFIQNGGGAAQGLGNPLFGRGY